MARSPLRDGWRVLMRAPAAVLTEIVWRWTFGVAFWAILYYSFREYFASIDISNSEYAALRSLEPYTWVAITARVVVAFMMGLRLMGPIIIPALIILWTALATLGRAATVRALSDSEPRTNWTGTAILHLLRIVLLVASLLAYFGCGILINTLVGDPSRKFAATFLLTFLALALIALVWSVVNWFLSLATIFTSRDARGTIQSLSDVARFYRDHSGRLAGAGLWFAFARSILVIGSTIVSLWLFTQARPRLAVLFIVIISLAYFALADALNIWRLAAYISLTEPESAPPVVSAPPPPPPPLASTEAEPATALDTDSEPKAPSSPEPPVDPCVVPDNSDPQSGISETSVSQIPSD